MTTTVPTTTSNILASDGSYEVVVLTRDNRVSRVIFRSPHYAAALSYLSRNIERKPWLDIVQNGRFVAWELEPVALLTELVMA